MKIKWTEALYILLAFTFCFMFKIQQIFLANILFFVLLLLTCRKVRFGPMALVSFALFIVAVLVSTVAYLGNVPFGIRSLFQLCFNFQYIFLLVNMDYNNKKLDGYILLFSIVLSVWIIAAYILSGSAFKYTLPQLLIIGRAWGTKLICGWPNETVLPLLYGLFLNLFVQKQSKVRKAVVTAILCFALLLTTSRSAFLGAGVMIAFFVFKNIFKLPVQKRNKFLGIIGGCVLVVAIFVLTNNDLRTRLFYMADRNINVVVAMDYWKSRPILGYGGNTLDILYTYDPSPLVDRNLQHTHNTILELLVRYGALGLVTFLLLLWCSVRKIRKPEAICALVLFWGLSLFQIYFRNFIFLMIIILLIKRYTPAAKQYAFQIDVEKIRLAVLQKLNRKQIPNE